MSTLVVVAYEEEFKAQETRTALLRLQKAHLIDLEDAVVARKNSKGKLKLEQMHNMTAAKAVSGGFWGALIGVLFMAPGLGLAVGAASGAVSGALTDVGIDDDFIRTLGDRLQPGTSALFVLATDASPDKVLDELRGSGGQVMHTSLGHADEAKLQSVLDGAS